MNRPEQKLHIAVASFLKVALPPGVVAFHCPNGGKRSKAEASLLKAMGVLAGVPDWTIILPNGQAAFIELKADGGRMSDAQLDFRERVLALRCGYEVCASIDDVERTLTDWLERTKGAPLRAHALPSGATFRQPAVEAFAPQVGE